MRHGSLKVLGHFRGIWRGTACANKLAMIRPCQFRTSPRLLSSRVRQLRVLVATLTGSMLWLVACSKPSVGSEGQGQVVAAPEVFPITTPERKTVRVEREFVAEVKAVQYATVRPRSLGSIQSVLVDEGQTVKAGQVLFQLNTLELEEQLRKSKAETNTVRAELLGAELEERNTRLLFEKNVVSDAVMQLASSKVALLKAKIDESRANESQVSVALGFARVRAPFDGVVNRISHRIGSLVDEKDLLTTITDTREVFVYFRMSERDYLQYQAEADGEADVPVSLRLADGMPYSAPGKIDAIESEFDRETGNIAFRARFPNPDGSLRHGSSGKVVVGRELTNVLVVPQRATFEVQGDLHLYVVDSANVARARRVVPRARLKDSFVVESGLDADDRFIVEGVQRVRDGLTVGVPASG